ncbi:MAG: hypothetical protein H6549_13640 [Chitinophagales bacterium]|nr:hypothetical protein [Chitinophagales bacterium]
MPKGLFLLVGLFILINASGQFTPVPVTGFNQDAIAEGPPSSLSTTTMELDGASSNKVMYTVFFRNFGGLFGGGLPDNGTIVNGADTYQLANYNGNNALYVKRNESFGLDLPHLPLFPNSGFYVFPLKGPVH